jgi:glycerophosphoryl diester phosphodiesterase
MRPLWPIIAIVIAASALGGYWFSSGAIPAEPAPGWITARPFAHRGLHDDARPENSLPAFSAAIEAGHPIELDVHLTADREVVVLHDEELRRMTGDSRSVGDVTLAELDELRLQGTDERIPRLWEVLVLAHGRVPILVELKSRGAAGPLEREVAKELEGYTGDVGVISFNPYSLAWFAENLPDLPRGQLSGSFSGEDVPAYQVLVLRPLLMNWKSRPHFIAYELEAMPSAGTWLQRKRGRPVLAWTPADTYELERAREVADNAICDPGALE